jgi:hypothetical protein
MIITFYKLTTDLTRYHPAFVVGAVGKQAPDYRRGEWGRGQPDRFFAMEIDGACIDVMWSSVERVQIAFVHAPASEFGALIDTWKMKTEAHKECAEELKALVTRLI